MALAAATLIASCKGGGETPGTSAYDYQGFWLMTSLTMDFDGTVDTLTRGGTPTALLGDALVTATSSTGADLSVRFAGTQDEVLLAAPVRSEGTVLVEEGKWVVSNENDPADPADDTVSVFTVTLVEGVLTLDVDPSDPRHADPGGPLQIVVERQAPWGTTATGAWEVATLDFGTGPEDPGACTMIGGGEWARDAIDVTVDERWMLAQSFTTNVYGTNTCTGMPTVTTRELVGYAEEEGTELRLWVHDALDPAGSGHLVFELAPTGLMDLTLTRTGCTPGPFCAGQPLELVLTPAP